MRDREINETAHDEAFVSVGNWWNTQLDTILRTAVDEGWPRNRDALSKLPVWRAAFPDEFASWTLNRYQESVGRNWAPDRVWRKELEPIYNGHPGPTYVWWEVEDLSGYIIDVDDIFDFRHYHTHVEAAAIGRAVQLGFIKRPERVPCALCGKLVFDFDLHRSHFCLECLGGPPNGSMGKRAILQYARDLAEVTGTVPTLHIAIPENFSTLDVDMQVKIMRLRKNYPSIERVRETFGSWLAVLIKSGILPEGTQKMSRGIRSIAKDGHVCHSIPEKVICDFLHSEGIEHSREPMYPGGSKLRADFKIGDIYIEYFGLAGNADYDAKVAKKREVARENSLHLVELFPEDMADWQATRNRLIGLLKS
ncbi:hypothetical protein [Nocardia alni]|uniref:hypothetical protein n=1 Tax=Nocardia alni TaxID=2815723 RepID=UPI001C23ACA2|nr:hypothetical protein [Nocardia alni]